MSLLNLEEKMSQDKYDETVAAQESLLNGGNENGLNNVKIQEQTGANSSMDIEIKKAQSKETIGHQGDMEAKTVFEIPKKTKQRALIMQVGQ